MDKIKAFAYLDDLRESGVTNMFGAATYLEEMFGLSRKDARELTLAWMNTFDPNKSVEERAILAGLEAEGKKDA